MERAIDVLEENLNLVLREGKDETFYFFGIFLSISVCVPGNIYCLLTALPE
jgi:hypothetical protein